MTQTHPMQGLAYVDRNELLQAPQLLTETERKLLEAGFKQVIVDDRVPRGIAQNDTAELGLFDKLPEVIIMRCMPGGKTSHVACFASSARYRAPWPAFPESSLDRAELAMGIAPDAAHWLAFEPEWQAVPRDPSHLIAVPDASGTDRFWEISRWGGPEERLDNAITILD